MQMKVILSRKGFDSAAGGGPSPIVDGIDLVSLPIEHGKRERRCRFNDLRINGERFGPLIERLHPQISRLDFCHLDPDIRRDLIPGREKDRQWQPLFGQADISARHLINKGICEGDLFLFFGLFRESIGWDRFAPGAPKQHVVFGWLQVEEVILDPIRWAKQPANRWAAAHPHTYGKWPGENILFRAKKRLEVNGSHGRKRTRLPGAGVFHRYHSDLSLTDPDGKSASSWRLPRFLAPAPKRGRTISHIGDGLWDMSRSSRYVYFSPGYIRRWQEAVFEGNADAEKWACQLIEYHS